MIDHIPATPPNWHPIESAPRDGTMVLLYAPDECHKMFFGRFLSREVFEYGVSLGVTEMWLPRRDGIGYRIDTLQPTHWMPLPLGPNGEAL